MTCKTLTQSAKMLSQIKYICPFIISLLLLNACKPTEEDSHFGYNLQTAIIDTSATQDTPFIHFSGFVILPKDEKEVHISVKGTNLDIHPNLTNNFEVYLDSSWRHQEIELIIKASKYKEIHYILASGDFSGTIKIDIEKGKVDAPSMYPRMIICR